MTSDAFMPHGMCYLWQPEILTLHVASDALIALAYFSIPFTLLYFVRKRTDLQFNWMFRCFAVFIVACGLTHVMDIWTIWYPAYWLAGGIKAATAVASVATAILLLKLVPAALLLPRPSALASANYALRREVDERTRVEAELREVNTTLESQVAERTAQLHALNRTLSQDNERFELGADAAGLGFWRFDAATSTLDWDDRMFLLYGRSRPSGSVPYTFWMNSVHPDDRDRCAREVVESLTRKRPLETEFRIVLPNGGVRHVRTAARITEDTTDGAMHLFGVDLDITERRRADERFRLAIEASPTGMLMISLIGTIVLVNEKIEVLFGYSRDELLGRHIDTLLPERFRFDGPNARNSIFDDPHTGTLGIDRDVYGLHKDGHEVPIEVALNPIHTSDGDFCLSSWIDITDRKHAEAVSQQMAALVESAEDAIMTKDLNGVILSWNRAAQQLLGYSADEIIGKPMIILLPDDRQDEESLILAQIRSGERVAHFETLRRRKDGSAIDVSLTISPIRNRLGTIVGASKIMRDITERKRASEHFRLALEATPTGMLMLDNRGLIVLVNPQIERLLGYTRAELLGQQIEMLLPERHRALHPEHRADFFGAPRPRTMSPGKEIVARHKEGAEIPVEIELHPLSTPEGTFVLSSIVDLSKNREVDRMRSDFVSTVSHELRTPLTSISGALGLLHTGAVGALPDKANAMVRIAFKNSERLVRIINDILDIGKLEAGKLVFHYSAVPLSDFLRQSIEANSIYADKFGVRFVVEDAVVGEMTFIDPDRLMQVLTNLLSNAAKFSTPGSDVRIRASCHSATTLWIEVQDSGPGIPEEFKGRIFEKFSQADASATRRFEGTGLGLSIARTLIEGMGGSIGFSSTVGQGTTFHVELPRMDCAARDAYRRLPPSPVALAPAPDTAHTANTDAAVPRLLYVEDDWDLVTVIKATMADRAIVVPAHGLREAERLLREESFKLIILDQSLPDGDGISLVEKIPGLAGRDVPVVVFSSSTVPAEVYEKVTHVFLKSQISAREVANKIMSYLGGHTPP